MKKEGSSEKKTGYIEFEDEEDISLLEETGNRSNTKEERIEISGNPNEDSNEDGLRNRS